MFEEGQFPLFLYDLEEKQAIRNELGLTEKMIQEDIEVILQWFEKQPHLVEAGLPEKDFVERMLIAAKGSQEKTKIRIDYFYTYRFLAPEFTQHRERHIDTPSWTFINLGIIPKMYELKRVIVLQLCDPDPNHFFSDIVYLYSYMIGDLKMKFDYTLGDIWILDLNMASFSHLLRFNISETQKAVKILQDAFGLRLFGLHLIGAPSKSQYLFNYFKRFLKQKILDRLVFHETFEGIYNHVPKNYLPKDYGGEQPSIQQLSDNISKVIRMKNVKSYILECCKQVSNESLRPNKDMYQDFLNGSFRKLDID